MLKHIQSDPSVQPDPFPGLPAHTVGILRAEGISDLATWAQLSPSRRRSIFGISRAVAQRLNQLSKERLT